MLSTEPLVTTARLAVAGSSTSSACAKPVMEAGASEQAAIDARSRTSPLNVDAATSSQVEGTKALHLLPPSLQVDDGRHILQYAPDIRTLAML